MSMEHGRSPASVRQNLRARLLEECESLVADAEASVAEGAEDLVRAQLLRARGAIDAALALSLGFSEETPHV